MELIALALLQENTVLKRTLSDLLEVINDLEQSETSIGIDLAIDEPELKVRWERVRNKIRELLSVS